MASAATSVNLGKYLQPVPLPGQGIVVATPSGTNQYSFKQVPIERQLHPQLPPTPLWAYDDGSGLAWPSGIVRHGGHRADRHAAEHKLHEPPPRHLPGVDSYRHAADPLGNQVRVMTHLHGGFVDRRQRR